MCVCVSTPVSLRACVRVARTQVQAPGGGGGVLRGLSGFWAPPRPWRPPSDRLGFRPPLRLWASPAI